MNSNEKLGQQLKREIQLLQHQLRSLENVELDSRQRRLAAECQVKLESRNELLNLLEPAEQN